MHPGNHAAEQLGGRGVEHLAVQPRLPVGLGQGVEREEVAQSFNLVIRCSGRAGRRRRSSINSD